jgi:hypothetical protein
MRKNNDLEDGKSNRHLSLKIFSIHPGINDAYLVNETSEKGVGFCS